MHWYEFLNFMRVFLAALRDGYDSSSGKVFCKGSGNFEDFKSFNELMDAWKHQIRFYAKASVVIDTSVDIALEESVHDIVCSTFVDNCIQRGKTIKESGAKYDYISGLQVGIANLGNSIAAIKKLVFEDKLISKSELMKNLDNNYKGLEGEKIRQMILNKAPKFGNGDKYVDDLLCEAYKYFIDEIEKFHNTRYGKGPSGGKYFASTSSISSNIPIGAELPATPDGRKAFTPVAEGASPAAGTDTNGPTAVFYSISKLPSNRILGGVLLNQKLSPSTIKEESSKRKLISLIVTLFNDLKGWHVQFNIVSRKMLLEAKKNPNAYRDLVVRVAGYSALFNTLSPDTQDDIISRTEQIL